MRVLGLLRAFHFLEALPRRRRGAAVVAVAAELGFRKSAFYARWRAYRHVGVQSLIRPRRSDFGSCRVFSPELLEAIRQTAPKICNGGFRRAWRAAGCPGSAESYRRWAKRFRKAG
ncbi:MAG TPA: hypothetical protein VKV17_17895 [Bryobacteraceae bacterium]|nr:hypothetical protein [Bryobacteraceae bacterium]